MCDVIKEIVERMPGVEQASKEYKDTIIKVEAFLEKGAEHVDRTLGALERAMVDEINDRLTKGHPPLVNEVSTKDAVARLEDYDQKLPWYLQHVLTAVLSKHESQLGFTLYSRTGDDQNLAAATYTGFVEPAEFRQRLVKGMQFKDPTVPGAHGEFTHRIQWYIITNAVEEPPERWVEFYKWIGKVQHTKPKANDKERWKDLGLWDALVDRNENGQADKNGPYNTSEDSDFRSPENFHKYILEKLPQSCPLLSTWMSRRNLKRMNTLVRLNLEGPIKNYVAKKMFDTTYDRLSGSDKGVVDKALETKLLLPGPKRKQEVSFVDSAQAAIAAQIENATAIAQKAKASLNSLFNNSKPPW